MQFLCSDYTLNSKILMFPAWSTPGKQFLSLMTIFWKIQKYCIYFNDTNVLINDQQDETAIKIEDHTDSKCLYLFDPTFS